MSNQSSRLAKLMVICGPTASGKTGMAVALAKKFNGEVISADSRAIYRGMDIGTAKPSPEEIRELRIKNYELRIPVYIIRGILHYGFDLVEPDEDFSVANFKDFATAAIKDVQSRGKLPILVGGTGLYISAVTENLEIPRVPANKALREKLEQKSAEELFEDLKRLDPATAKVIDRHNRRRLIRALELKITTGISKTQLIKRGAPLFDTLKLGIKITKEKLYKNIDERVDEQFEMGLENEVKNLYETLRRKYSDEQVWILPAMSGICYGEFKDYFAGKISLADVARLIKLHNRQYARRQATWLKRDKEIHWMENIQETEKLIRYFLHH